MIKNRGIKKRSCQLGILFLFFNGSANADAVSVPVDDSGAISFYQHSQLVVSKATVNPFDLAGCLVLHKDGLADQYINVLPESIKKTLKPQNLTETVYRTMLTKDQAVKVGFLGMLGVEVSEKSLLEISINDRWKMEGPSFWGDSELKKTVLEVGKIYALQGYKVSYNQNVQYSILASSDFQQNDASVSSTFTYVDGSGKKYVQSSNYTQRELISIAPFDITGIVNSWGTSTNAAVFKIDKQQIEDSVKASANVKAAAIHLNAADLAPIKAELGKISPGDFKNRVLY